MLCVKKCIPTERRTQLTGLEPACPSSIMPIRPPTNLLDHQSRTCYSGDKLPIRARLRLDGWHRSAGFMFDMAACVVPVTARCHAMQSPTGASHGLVQVTAWYWSQVGAAVQSLPGASYCDAPVV